MSARREADTAALLLPFYVNGTLEDEDRDRVAAHLEQSPEARDEVAFLSSVRGRFKERAAHDGPSPLERTAILERIRGEEQRTRPHLQTWALAAVALLAVVQGSVLWKITRSSAEPGVAATSYRPAGAPSTAQIAVQFVDAATARQIRELLLAEHLLVVDGPSALGVYELTFSADAGDAVPIEDIIQRLRAQEIVSYAKAL